MNEWLLSTVREKLAILSDAAKYDASCASSGAAKRNSLKSGGIGSTEGMGICHSYAPDGRCISLLKILLTNFCIYDCSYCINRSSSNVRRARFTRRRGGAADHGFLQAQLHRGPVPVVGRHPLARRDDGRDGRGRAAAARGRKVRRLHPSEDHPRMLGRTARAGGPLCRPAVDQCRAADRRRREEARAGKAAGNDPAVDGQPAQQDRGEGRADAEDQEAPALRAGRPVDADDHRRRRDLRRRHPARPARGSTAAIICAASTIPPSARSRIRRRRCR